MYWYWFGWTTRKRLGNELDNVKDNIDMKNGKRPGNELDNVKENSEELTWNIDFDLFNFEFI